MCVSVVPINRSDDLSSACRLESQGMPHCVCVCSLTCTAPTVLNKYYITLRLRAAWRGNSRRDSARGEEESFLSSRRCERASVCVRTCTHDRATVITDVARSKMSVTAYWSLKRLCKIKNTVRTIWFLCQYFKFFIHVAVHFFFAFQFSKKICSSDVKMPQFHILMFHPLEQPRMINYPKNSL